MNFTKILTTFTLLICINGVSQAMDKDFLNNQDNKVSYNLMQDLSNRLSTLEKKVQRQEQIIADQNAMISQLSNVLSNKNNYSGIQQMSQIQNNNSFKSNICPPPEPLKFFNFNIKPSNNINQINNYEDINSIVDYENINAIDEPDNLKKYENINSINDYEDDASKNLLSRNNNKNNIINEDEDNELDTSSILIKHSQINNSEEPKKIDNSNKINNINEVDKLEGETPEFRNGDIKEAIDYNKKFWAEHEKKKNKQEDNK